MSQGIPVPAAARVRVAPVKFGHIVFGTSRQDAMVDWYRTVLEADAAMTRRPRIEPDQVLGSLPDN